MMRPTFALQSGDEPCGSGVVVLGDVQGRGELSFQLAGCLDQVLDALVADHEGCRAENFLVQDGVVDEYIQLGGEHGRCRCVFSRSLLAAAENLHIGCCFEGIMAVLPGRGDASAKHGLAGQFADGAGDCCGEALTTFAGGDEDQAGGGAELSRAAGDGSDVLLGQRLHGRRTMRSVLVLKALGGQVIGSTARPALLDSTSGRSAVCI